MKQPSIPSRAERRQQWLEQVDTALRVHGADAAARVAVNALADGVEHPALLNLGAQARFDEGRVEEAVEMLKRARSLAPKDPHVLNTLGICLADLGRNTEALASYGAALRADPEMAPAHYNRAVLLESLNDINGARSGYGRAIALDPNYADALAALSWLDALAGDLEAATSRARMALASAPTNVLARMALASSDLQRKDFAGAAARLSELEKEPALAPGNRSIVLGLIGDLLDARDQTTEAFAAYEASNATLKAANASRYEVPGEENALEQVRRLAAFFGSAEPEVWREAPAVRPRAADPKAHIFLVGFPRSGTTLLENVLAAHPEVVSLEEKDCFAPETAAYLASNEGLRRLAGISSGEALRQREHYWAAVRKNGVEPRGRVFIDKMPLWSVMLPVIAKLFPNARILFARRDPRDVVLSCFRRRFGMNPSMYQLLTLDGAAAFYDAAMGVAQIYEELLPLPRHVVRYEGLVEDFEGTARAACGFLGIEWTPALTEFAAKARTRGISTPSAAQVSRGLNREGQGAWRRYRDQIAPVLPLLEPWVRRFGYASE